MYCMHYNNIHSKQQQDWWQKKWMWQWQESFNYVKPVLWEKPGKQKYLRLSINIKSSLRTVFIDISSPTAISLGSRKHWLLIVDDCTNYALSYFLKENSALPDKVNKLIKTWRQNVVFKWKRFVWWCSWESFIGGTM